MTDSSLSYRVRVHPAEHEIEVELDFQSSSSEPKLFQLATWVPGAYAFMRFARNLSDLRATDLRTGADLPVQPDGWQAFRVPGGAHSSLRLRYKAFVYEPAWGELTGLVDHEYAVLMGTHYLSPLEHTGPCRVTYEVPAGWAIHHPSGGKAIDATTWEYASFEQLLDTPVVMGRVDRRQRSIQGTLFHFVFLDRAVGFDSEVDAFLDQIARIAEECHALFGSFPFTDYTFVFSCSPTAHWGLEHASSTLIGLTETVFVDSQQRARALRVSAHELFHAWNVRSLKPAPLMRYDAAGGFTEGLWIGEGFTRYYEFLLLARIGALSVADFLSNVVSYYRQLVAMPAYERVSVLESSRSTFINHHRYNGSINNAIDYYDKGMLIAFDMDVAMRTSSARTSLDREFGAFYDTFVGKELGFTTEQALQFFGKSAPGLGELLEREVTRPGGLSVPQMLERLGFQVTNEKLRYLGLVLKDNTGPVVAQVLERGPAGRSGLAPEDEIVRVAGFPFNLKALHWLIAHERSVTLEVRRGHRLLTFSIETGDRIQLASLRWQGSQEQSALIRDWLKQSEFEPEAGQLFAPSSFENFHGIQTVL